jgi:carbon monoxide dehydrogenase subunit G
LQIHSTFDVAEPVSRAWTLLTDIKGIASCMPGSELTEALGDNRYKGRVTVRLGPVMLTFDGTARLEEMDPVNHRARVSAQGSDKKGRGGATADIRFRLERLGDGTKVLIVTDLRLFGSVAQYGRGAGMINELASQLVQQFAASLREKISANGAPADDAESGAPDLGAAPIPVLGLVWRSFWAALVKAAKSIFAPP